MAGKRVVITGVYMGATSVLESIICCLTIKEDLLPLTINFKTPDPECDIDYVPNTASKVKANIALNNGLTLGGNNCCVIFENINKYD